MRISDWSSDVCSSDLLLHLLDQARFGVARWRLRLVALDLDTGLGGRVALCHRGQQARVLVVRTVIATFVIKGKERSEERRVGKECGSTCRSRGSPDH